MQSHRVNLIIGKAIASATPNLIQDVGYAVINALARVVVSGLKDAALDRSEEIFREYGELATFVCRLLPAIRQLISIPAGLSRMDLRRFSFFTALGAGLWTAVLAGLGWYFGKLSAGMSYLEMINRGKAIIHEHYIYIFIGLALLVAAYLFVHHKVMQSKKPESSGQSN